MRRIGLSQRVDVPADRNERRDALDQAWPRLLLDNGLMPIPLPNRPGDAETLVRELGLDGVILTGGNDLSGCPGAVHVAEERDLFEHGLLDLCSEREIPVLGVCRGLQLMVMHYGGKLERLGGHVATLHPIAAHAHGGMSLESRDAVNSFHAFGVPRGGLGGNLVALASAPDGFVEAVAHRSKPQWGVMWHPEREPYDRRDATMLLNIFETVPV